MAITQSITYGVGGSNPLSKTVSVTGALTEISETIAALASSFEVNCAIDISALKSIYVNGSGAMTLAFYNGVTARESITLVANEPLVWTHKSLLTCPLVTSDLTVVKVTSTDGGTLDIRIVQDATP